MELGLFLIHRPDLLRFLMLAPLAARQGSPAELELRERVHPRMSALSIRLQTVWVTAGNQT